MASVASSSGVSPHPGFETDDSSESFLFVDSTSSTGSHMGSLGINGSPSSGSMNSWVYDANSFMIPSPPIYPLELTGDATTSMVDTSTGNSGNGEGLNSFLSADLDQYDPNAGGIEVQQGLNMSIMQQGYLLQESPIQGPVLFPTTSSNELSQNNLMGFDPLSSFPEFGIPNTIINYPMESWSLSNPQGMSSQDEEVISSLLPDSPEPKQEPIDKASIPSRIRKVRGTGARVEKKRTISSSDSSSLGSSPTSKFVIMTPNTISANAGKPNPYECLDAMRPSQRGRKGPLANATKENALQVRRRGACFHCHARKVKCDMERPCKNCKKLISDIPQVICWQFQDFIPILFPDFIRGHFENSVLRDFVRSNVQEFKLNGVEETCTAWLSIGDRFDTKLSIHAKWFTPRGEEIQRHWHVTAQGDVARVHAERTTPIGLEMTTNNPKDELRNDLKDRLKAFVEALLKEPLLADQVTETLIKQSPVPRDVMRAIHQYAQDTEHPIVTQALSICAMHFIMTRLFTITSLKNDSKRTHQYVAKTSRLLNRQLKAIIDERLQKTMTKMYEDFSRALKSKSRSEWAPCLAAFLVACIFMESIESATDLFVSAENEISLNQTAPSLSSPRRKALDIIDKIDNMPFKQVAYQFHQVFMTHTKDAAAKSFNPLVDDSFLTPRDLDPKAIDMVWQLRETVEMNRGDLEMLAADAVLPNIEAHALPSNTADRYAGRLVSKFLLSFTDEKYIFEPQAC